MCGFELVQGNELDTGVGLKGNEAPVKEVYADLRANGFYGTHRVIYGTTTGGVVAFIGCEHHKVDKGNLKRCLHGVAMGNPRFSKRLQVRV